MYTIDPVLNEGNDSRCRECRPCYFDGTPNQVFVKHAYGRPVNNLIRLLYQGGKSVMIGISEDTLRFFA